jgi:hypothetical protein
MTTRKGPPGTNRRANMVLPMMNNPTGGRQSKPEEGNSS